MHRLPSRIAVVMVSTVVLFVLTVGFSVLWMTRALDRQALEQSVAQIEVARANLLSRARLITLDYAKWDTADEAIRNADLDWIFDNIGSTAMVGEAVQLAVVWGSPFGAPLAWHDGGGLDPEPDLVDPGRLNAVVARLDEVEESVFDGAEFFAWHHGDLYVMGAATVEPLEAPRPSGPDDARLMMGIRVSPKVLAGISDSLGVTGLSVLRHPTPEGPALALDGVGGTPVAYVAWDRPRPGTTMLLRMLPFLSLVLLAVSALAAMGLRLIHRGARNLVVAEHHASNAARTDGMTGLPNRAAFVEALTPGARAGARAILFLDMNGFKHVNDSLGHAAGDAVIRATAGRLRAFAGPDCFLARIAGDEFVLLLEGPDAAARVERMAAAVSGVFDAPFEVLGSRMRLQAAIGYAVQEVDGMDGADLVRQADLAMYEAKRLDEGSPVAFDAMLEAASQDALLVERGLRAALSGRPGEVFVAYQPIVGLDGAFSHAEALARWVSPELGSVGPERFIAVAEKAGLVIELGRLILELVLDDLARHPGLSVSVNISPVQLTAPDFVADLVAAFEARGVATARLEVELTESVLVSEGRLVAHHLQELQRAGFTIALDDFGTGYSSTTYLDQLSLDSLKIDRSFVSGMRFSPKRHALIAGMIHMAHCLDLKVVCEGVETAEDLRLLREMGCDLVQGFHVDPGLSIEALAGRWLGAGRKSAAA